MFDWKKVFEDQGFFVKAFPEIEYCKTVIRIVHKHYPFFLSRIVPNEWLMDDQKAKEFVESTIALYEHELGIKRKG